MANQPNQEPVVDSWTGPQLVVYGLLVLSIALGIILTMAYSTST